MYADDEAGGVGNSFKNMMEADPDFGKIENRHVNRLIILLVPDILSVWFYCTCISFCYQPVKWL